MPITDYALAGNDTYGAYTPNQLFSGERPVVTRAYAIAAGQVLDKYTVMARNAAGALVPVDPAQTDGRQLAMAILMTAMNTTAAAAVTPLGVALPANPAGAVETFNECYIDGIFNPAMLVWPASVTDIRARGRLFDRTTLTILSPL